jgi:hypothetical protein
MCRWWDSRERVTRAWRAFCTLRFSRPDKGVPGLLEEVDKMVLQDSARLDSALPEPGQSRLNSSSIDTILGGALSSAQQQLERAFRGLRERSEELESALEQARERNRQIEERNAELQAELVQARDRAARLEAAARMAIEHSSSAMMTLAGALPGGPDVPSPDPSEGSAARVGEAPEAAEDRSRLDVHPELAAEETGHPSEAASQQPEGAATEGGNGVAAPTSSGALSTGGQPGMTHLVASPFDSLTSVLRFQREVKKLPGVTDVKPVEFDEGVLRLAVWYSSEMTHLGALLGLTGYDLRLESPTDDAAEVCLAGGNGSAGSLGLRAS